MIILNGIYRKGDSGADVLEIQRLLIKAGITSITADGVYGPMTEGAVGIFQREQGLLDDGIVGPITWAKLNPFGAQLDNHYRSTSVNGTLDLAVRMSEKDMGAKEIKPNDSPRIREMLARVGIHAPAPYCMAAVYTWIYEAFTFNHFTDELRAIPKTAGVLDFYNRCPKAWRVANTHGQRGDIAIYSWGGGKGHTGLVTGYNDGYYFLNEGNTNAAGSRDGEGFYRKQRTKYNDPKLLGFIRIPDPGAGVPS